LITGAMQLVVHEAAVQMTCDASSLSSFTPTTTLRTDASFTGLPTATARSQDAVRARSPDAVTIAGPGFRATADQRRAACSRFELQMGIAPLVPGSRHYVDALRRRR
jgi:hypothetical protein